MRNQPHPAWAARGCGLIGDRSGTAAIEFAFLFPVMLALFFGSFEITNLVMVNLKLTAATEAASDLLAQTRSNQNTVAPSDLQNYSTAASMEMTPYASSPYTTVGLQTAYDSIIFNSSGTPSIAWHHELNGASTINMVSIQSTVTTLWNGSSTDSVIVVQSTISYASPISWVLSKNYSFSDLAYNRPRYVLQVSCPTC